MSWDWLGFKGRTSFEEGTELQLSILSRTLLRKSQVIGLDLKDQSLETGNPKRMKREDERRTRRHIDAL